MNFLEKKQQRKFRSLIISLAIVSVGMFGFSYLMVPFYNALCKTLGINGKPSLVAVAQAKDMDASRDINMEFVTTMNANLTAWEFYSKVKSLKLHPGENQTVLYFVKNNTDQEMTVQAIPSVAPGLAAKYVLKSECFCFTQQTLKAHEAKIMPLLFHIDQKIPANINNLTLSYTLFAANKKI